MGHEHSHPNQNRTNQLKLDVNPSQRKDSNDTLSPMSPASVVSRQYSQEKLQRFSSCLPANNTMSLILPQTSVTLSPTNGAQALGVKSKSMSPSVFTKSCSLLPRSSSVVDRGQSPATSTPKSGRRKRRNSTLLIFNNGVTVKYISSRICKIAARFWHNNIENVSLGEQLEIGCSIFFGMLASNPEMKKVMKKNFGDTKKIENTSLKYLDMMGWLIRYLITDNVDLYALLTRLGHVHRSMGIGIQHFPPMLTATHEALGYYFENKYSIEVKYAMDEIFSLAAQLMTGQPLQQSTHLMNITQQFSGQNIPFLKNLNVCLKSSVGQEYLYRYLAQTWCDEMVIFLKSLHRFERELSDKARFMIAREITKVSIEPTATFSLNLSYDTRQNALFEMSKLELTFGAKKALKVSVHFFDEVEREINHLILDNHWAKFVDGIECLHSNSKNSIVD
eukprot:96053_1